MSNNNKEELSPSESKLMKFPSMIVKPHDQSKDLFLSLPKKSPEKSKDSALSLSHSKRSAEYISETPNPELYIEKSSSKHAESSVFKEKTMRINPTYISNVPLGTENTKDTGVLYVSSLKLFK